jgi:hypothetical protein
MIVYNMISVNGNRPVNEDYVGVSHNGRCDWFIWAEGLGDIVI